MVGTVPGESASAQVPDGEGDGSELESTRGETGAAFPIVGIGASAGGLAAFESFFSGMPSDIESGMAFVLVQHLAPDHKSILTELVKRYTRMQVFEVEDGMQVSPNSVYIIPPNRDMAFLNGSLQLFEPTAVRGYRLPIDFFFRSLAQDQHERAVCIVLSGTGSDGTGGVRAVKGEGGMVMAQLPESTEYDGMPRSAIHTGLVDYVLPPAEMPAQLIAFAGRAWGNVVRPIRLPSARGDDELKKIFVLLRARTGHDFSQYKTTTIGRRIERRMAVQQVEQYHDYVRFLRETPLELDALFRDLLIGVTQFFRDPEAFKSLETEVIPRLVADKLSGSPIRVWVPGCSTGEEAYSIAILLREKLESLGRGMDAQVFASDIDARAIETARAGVYPPSIGLDLTAERLAQHFAPLEDGSYRVQKRLRDLIIFSEQDVGRDPPFSKLDLISCRNLLIYLDPPLQKKIISLFHYALNPDGALFLGTSETIGELTDLFVARDRKAKLYRRAENLSGSMRPPFAHLAGPSESREARTFSRKGSGEQKLPLREVTERALLEHGPVAVLTNERGDLLYLHGHTGRYLELAPGEMGANVLKMARDGLRSDLTSALHKAIFQKTRVFRPGLRIKTNGDYAAVDLTVTPVPVSGVQGVDDSPLFLMIFEESRSTKEVGAAGIGNLSDEASDAPQVEDPRIQGLLNELRIKDDDLRATQEEMQTSNEELRSSFEELQSTNEELQSTNEELETSKEELQSVNEELATVNAELQSKVSDLSRLNNDMSNLLAATGIGTIFVDNRMCIRRFTPAATQFVNVIPSDIGRPLSHIVSNLGSYDRLVADVQGVLDTLTAEKVEVKTAMGASFLLRIRPYRTAENAIEGAVITFTEVNAVQNIQAALRESDTLRGLVGAVRDARDAITVHDLEGQILAWNPGAVRMYGWSEAEALRMNICALVPKEDRELALGVIHQLSLSETLEPYRTRRIAKQGEVLEVTLTASALVDGSGAVYGISTLERGGKAT